MSDDKTHQEMVTAGLSSVVAKHVEKTAEENKVLLADNRALTARVGVLQESLQKAYEEGSELEEAVKSLQLMINSKESIIRRLRAAGALDGLRFLTEAWQQAHACVHRADTLLAQEKSPELSTVSKHWEVERLIGALGVLMVLTRPSKLHDVCAATRDELRECFGPDAQESESSE